MSSKELTAMTFNLKQQKILHKTLSILNIEESYSLKLVNLNMQTVKAGHNKLKSKVSKLKKNLTPEEEKLVEKEEKRKYGALSKVGPSCNMLRIQAASKRLKLWSNAEGENDENGNTSSSTRPNSENLDKGNHVYGRSKSSMEIATPRTVDTIPLRRAKSSNKLDVSNTEQLVTPRKDSPVSKSYDGNPTKTNIRAKSAFEFGTTKDMDKTNNEKPRPKTTMALGRSDNKTGFSLSLFPEKPANKGPSKYEERRQNFLKSESQMSLELDNKKDKLFTRIDKLIEDTPSLEKQLLGKNQYLHVPSKEAAIAARKARTSRKKKERVEFKKFGEKLSEEEYKKRLLAMWEGMNKCRYLRVSEDKIDLSGYQTLVKDQLSVLSLLRNPEKNDEE